MNIDGRTTTVMYTGIGGYDYDRDHANKHLTVGGVYKIASIDVDNYHSVVLIYVDEKPFWFNSVMFEDVEREDIGLSGILDEIRLYSANRGIDVGHTLHKIWVLDGDSDD